MRVGIRRNNMITIAVPKGYLMKETLALLAKQGITFSEDFESSRKLFIFDDSAAYKILVVRPWDVAAYVEQGAADIGVVGKDVLLEQDPQILTLKDLHFGGCKLVIAGTSDQSIESLPHHCRVVTKYPYSAEQYFSRRGKKVKIIKLYGAIELGPLTGISDVICDLTATGKTLKDHGLHVLDTVFESTAHLIANPIGLRMHYSKVKALSETL